LAGYDQFSCGSDLERPEFVPIAFTASTGVSGIRTSPAAGQEPAASCSTLHEPQKV
jgi:hypothetical protein